MEKKKIALLSNVTIDMVAMKLGKKYDVYTPGGYDVWMSEALNNESGIYTEVHDAIFLILDGTELKYKDAETVEKKGELWKSGILKLAECVTSIPLFISTVDFRESEIKSFSERKKYLGNAASWHDFLQDLRESHENIYVLDLLAAIINTGRRQFYSNKMWYVGSMPYSKTGIEVVASEIDLAAEAAFEQRRKVLVLDLDNTLWGGVIGEDGVDAIELSDHKEGARFYDFQNRILEMKRRGTVLAIDSKNNEPDVDEVFNHRHMVLKKEDFVNTKINWKDKASNLKEMETELNMTESSFVFVDDNPMERDIVRGMCDEIIVPDFPEDTTELTDFAEKIYKTYFRQLRTTDEDLKKTQMYRSEARRKQVEKHSLNLDDYIRILEIKVDIHEMHDSEIDRVHQLINKTNQFNLTTKRYSLSELKELEKRADIITVSAKDKFGDNGLVAVVICIDEGEDVLIDTFLMSCRVMGRKLEDVIMSCLIRKYGKQGESKRLVGTYISTAKNAPVETLYDRLGFNFTGISEGVKRYEYILDKPYPEVESYDEVNFEN